MFKPDGLDFCRQPPSIHLRKIIESEMGIIYFMIGASIVLALIFLIAYYWAVNNGQFDDDSTPSIRILFDDESEETTNHK